MLDFCKYYLLLSALVSLRLTTCDYIYKRINGNLDSKHGMNLSLFIESFKGIVIYAIDSSNKFLVELESERMEHKIIIKFNKFSISKTSKIICGCSTCSEAHMKISLQTVHENLTIECNGIYNQISLVAKHKWPDLFAGYPIPKHLSNITKTTFVWMGNIGPYYGDKDMLFLPLKNQFKGCIVELYFQNQLVDLDGNSTHVRNSCDKYICHNKEIDSDYFNIMNFTKSTQQKLSYTGEPKLHPINNKNTSIVILKWNQTLTNNYKCQTLMEIYFKNNVTVVIQIDTSRKVFMKTYTSHQMKCQNTMVNGLETGTFKLLVKFDNNHIVTGIFNNLNKTFDLKKMTEDVYEEPVRIQVGYSELSNCSKFDGTIDLETFVIEDCGFWCKIKPMIQEHIWILLTSVSLVFVFILIALAILNVNIENCKFKIQENPSDPVEMESVNRLSQFPNKQIVNISMPTNESSIYEYIPDC